MNRDRRTQPERRPYRLWMPKTPHGARGPAVDAGDIAPWIFATVRAWPRSVEDRLVAVRIGVPVQHVQLARRRPA